jgi:carbohydrate-selective porin OprB
MPGVYLQPDFQYGFNPAARAGVTDTLSAGLRFGLNL